MLPPEVNCVTATTHPPYTISTSDYIASNISSTPSGESVISEGTVAPSSERLDSVVIIISSLTALCLSLVIFGITWAIRRKRSQENDVRVTAVKSDQSEAETLVPVDVITQLDVSEEPLPEEYEDIDRFQPTITVTSDSAQTSQYAQASSDSSHTYTPLERSKEEEHDYVNQIKAPEYANMYMSLTEARKPNMSSDNSRAYASLLKSEGDEDDGDYVIQPQALKLGLMKNNEIQSPL